MSELSKTFLEASLKLWRGRYEKADAALHAALTKGDRATAHKFGPKVGAAAVKVHLRERQLALLAPATKLLWMPGAEHRPRASAGAFASGYTPRGLLHKTEGMGDATSTLDQNGDHPHSEILTNGHIIQYIPLNLSAKALVHSGFPETNRASCVQVEIVGLEDGAAPWPPAQLAALRNWMRFVEANAGVERASHVRWGSDGQFRLDAAAWVKLTGWCGHQHVPENVHIDPGALDIGVLL